MSDPTIAAWSRENALLFQLRRLREETERISKRNAELEALLERQTALLERQTARIVDLQTHIENFHGEDR